MERATKPAFSPPFLVVFSWLVFFLFLLLALLSLCGPSLIWFIFNNSLMFVGSTWKTVLIASGRHPLFFPSSGLILLSVFVFFLSFSSCDFVLLSSLLVAVVLRKSESGRETSVPFPRSVSVVTHCCSQVWRSCCQFVVWTNCSLLVPSQHSRLFWQEKNWLPLLLLLVCFSICLYVS